MTTTIPVAMGPGSASARRSRPRLAILLVAVLVAIIGIALASANPVVQALGPAAAFVLLAGVAVTRERRRYGSFGVASPISLFTVFWFLYLGVMGLGTFRLPSTALLGLTDRAILDALWLAVLSLLMVYLGYEVVTRRPARRRSGLGRAQSTLDCSPLGLAAALLVGWTATVYLFVKHQSGYLQYGQPAPSGVIHLLIYMGAGLVPLSLAVLSAVVWSDQVWPSISRSSARILLFANIPPLVLISLATGVKGQLITYLTPMGIVYVLLRGRIPWKAVTLMAVYLVASFGGIQQYRTSIATGQLSTTQASGLLGPVEASIGKIGSSWTTGSITSHVETFWKNVSAEYSGTPQDLALIMTRTPSPTPYLSPQRYLAGPLFFLPSSTVTPAGFDLTSYMSATYVGTGPHTSAPTTQPGDFYMSGGIPLVIGGELVVGLLIGVLWRALSPSASRLQATVLYAVVAVSFVSAGLDFVGLVRGALQALLLYGVCCKVLMPQRSRAADIHAHAHDDVRRPDPALIPANDRVGSLG